MGDPGYGNEEVERMAGILERGGVSPDEQDAARLDAYFEDAAGRPGVAGRAEAEQLVYEALLYLKLKSAPPSADPLQEGDRFGAGFS